MQTLKASTIFIAAAIALSCSACSNVPMNQSVDKYRADFEGTINVLGEGGSSVTTLYQPKLVGVNGPVTMASQTETATIGEPILKTAGAVTTGHFETATYGYTLLVTPEFQPGEHFWSANKVRTSIKLDHGVKLADGRSSHQVAAGEADLAVGEQTKLTWTNDGKKYELSLRLAAVYPAGKAL